MQKLAITTLLGMCLLGTCAGTAQAEPVNNNSGNDWIIKVGVFQPGGNTINTNALVNDNSFINPIDQISVGAEYEFFPKRSVNGLGSAYTFSVDYMQVQRLFFANGDTFTSSASQTTIPLLVNYKYYWQASQNDRGYAGVGIGGLLGDYSGFAYSGFIGICPGPNLDVELRYIGCGSSSNLNGSTLSSLYGIDVGYHFR